MVLNTAENRIYRQDSAFANDQISRSAVLPNKNSYVVVRNANPGQSAIFHSTANGKGERVGYGVLMQSNGIAKQTRHLYHQTPTQNAEVTLPQTYLAHLSAIDANISANLAAGERVLQEAYVAINKYKRRICKGDVRADFMDSATYGRICLESGELSAFSEIMTKLQQDRQRRHEQARAELVRNQEVLARQQAAQSAQQRSEASALAQGVNEFAASMEAFQQRSADFTRAFINANPSQGVRFGQPDTVRTNCMRVSNIVHCRTQ
jgi:hypothetical protein